MVCDLSSVLRRREWDRLSASGSHAHPVRQHFHLKRQQRCYKEHVANSTYIEVIIWTSPQLLQEQEDFNEIQPVVTNRISSHTRDSAGVLTLPWGRGCHPAGTHHPLQTYANAPRPPWRFCFQG